jgi:protein-disulfide isomerase
MFQRILLMCLVFFVASSCEQIDSLIGSQNQKNVTITAQNDSGDSAILATFNGEAITEKDIEDKVSSRLRGVRQDLYEVRKSGVDQVIEERLIKAEATKQGVQEAELLQKNVNDKVQVADKEIEKFYQDNKARFQDKTLEESQPIIKGYLYQQLFQQEKSKYIASLKKKVVLAYNISPPRVEIAIGEHPSQGPDKAPVTLVECTDYQCPYCGRVRDTIQQVMTEYKGKVRYGLRDFPLSFHKDAPKAHEAAHCAGDQKKYWEYNKELFSHQRELKIDELKKYAKTIKLKQSEFDSCLDSGKYSERVRKSIQACAAAGVSGTPAFFINGRMISGARPFESFKEVIDDELGRS